MAVIDLVLPKLGESVMEATILRWHKKPGDRVMAEENLVDIATDKVDSEVPSEAAGILKEVLYQENDIVPVGAVIARIETDEAAAGTSPAPSADAVTGPAQGPEAAGPPPVSESLTQSSSGQGFTMRPSPTTASGGSRFYSPLVLNIAASENIPLSELEKLTGTGADGRVTKKDLLRYIAGRKSSAGEAAVPYPTHGPDVFASASESEHSASDLPSRLDDRGENVEIIEMDRMRKLIARHMLDSVRTSPHVTSFAEADVTNMVLWRERCKKEFEQREREKITFTPLFIEAIVRCLKKYPWLNSSVDGERLILRRDIHIGMATALPNGNLIVPVIRNADQLNLVGLTRQVNRLAQDARENKLRPDDTRGGTFTFTNIGSFGSIMGTPIINQPQVAILAAGAIKKRPVVVETDQGDSIAIRHIVYLSLSYDHRVIDGALGSTFLQAVARELEQFPPDRGF